MPVTELARSDKLIGFQSEPDRDATLTPWAVDPQSVIDTIVARLTNLETIAEGAVQKGDIKSQIALSDEGVLIAGQEIALVGNVTIVDIVNEQNGTTSGNVDPSITRIIGDLIQTGAITSNNWSASQGSAFDLDNETLTLGGSSDPSFYFDGTDLFLSGTLQAGTIIDTSATVGGTAIGDIKSNASAGYDIQQQLEVSGSTVLAGTIVPENAGGIKVGSITWNSTSGALTGGSGIAITEYGIIGAESGSATFTIVASTGASTWSGDIDTGGSVFADGATSQSGYNAAIIGIPSTSSYAGVIGVSVNSSGIRGITQNGDGIYGVAVNGAGNGGYFAASNSSSNALEVTNDSGTTILFSGFGIQTLTGDFTCEDFVAFEDDIRIEGDLRLNEKAAPSAIVGYCQLYGATDTDGKAVLGIRSEGSLASGTFSSPAFTRRIPQVWDGVEVWVYGVPR